MLSLIPLIAVSCAVAYTFALLKMMNAALEAPIGYEDESGFHFGIEASHEAE